MTVTAESITRTERDAPDLSVAPATGTSRGWLARFTYTERWLHWLNSLAFLVLAVTGLGLYVHTFEAAANQLLARLPGLLGHLELVDVHITAAILFILNPIAWFLFGDRRALLADARAILRVDADDRAWLRRVLTCHRPLPPQGRFNAGQKLSAIGLVLAWVSFLVTGLMQLRWPPFVHAAHGAPPAALPAGGAPGPGAGMPPAGGMATGPFNLFHFSMSGLETVHTIHASLALACVIWLAAHIYLSTLNRRTRHSLRGMLTGRVRRDWAAAHHGKWVAAVDARADAER